jgi:hypothetical protein
MRKKRIGTILVTVVKEASQLEVCPPQKTKEKKSSTSLWSLEAVKISLNTIREIFHLSWHLLWFI